MSQQVKLDPGASSGVAWVNGKFLPVAEAGVPLLDWGFTKGDCTYDVVGVWNDKFFRLEDHLDRFERGLAHLRLTMPVSRDELRTILAECVHRAGLKESYVSLTVTRGTPPPGVRDLRQFENKLYCYAIPYVHIHNAQAKGRGVDLVTPFYQRIPPSSVDPRVKNYHWLDMVMGVFQAYDEDADLPAMPDENGNITEGFGYNIFSIKDGKVVTPISGVLEGITRMTIFDICKDQGIEWDARELPAEEFRQSDEAFITSTAGGPMPVRSIDHVQMPAGGPGPVTQKITDVYWDWHDDPRWTIPVKELLK